MIIKNLSILLACVDLDDLGQDGFVIRTAGKQLLITGGTEKGTLYGVYAYLEKYNLFLRGKIKP